MTSLKKSGQMAASQALVSADRHAAECSLIGAKLSYLDNAVNGDTRLRLCENAEKFALFKNQALKTRCAVFSMQGIVIQPANFLSFGVFTQPSPEAIGLTVASFPLPSLSSLTILVGHAPSVVHCLSYH
ncbi:hypothetical protein [Undibacterium sp. WLHG33]|uniref:hypothetical protein n=1 Tax=Undibacterium sp. WLHG33 TaxID=3412482 RepID=UPI003C2B426E